MDSKDIIKDIEKAFNELGFDVSVKDLSDTFAEKVKDTVEKVGPEIEKGYEKVRSKMDGFKPKPATIHTDYRSTVENGEYSLVVVATGHSENDIKVDVNPTLNRIEISSSMSDDVKKSWFVSDIDGYIELPKNIRYSTLTKHISNGLLFINGKVAAEETPAKFTI